MPSGCCLDLRIFSSPQETTAFAGQFAAKLKANDVVLLTGDLGAGKTTFVKGLVQGLGSQDLVQSPTYVYLHLYEGRLPIFHFDLYRFKTSSDFLAMGFEEYFSKEGVVLIEWPERIESILPPNAWHVQFQTLSENERSLSISRGNAP